MKRLFLTSFFAEVSDIFKEYLGNELKDKKVTFIPTASINEEVNFYVQEAKDSFVKLGLEVDVLEISTSSISEIKEKIENNDYIYVSGGNTFFLLEQLKRTGADIIINEQINKGKLYIGESAGSVIVSPNIKYIEIMDSRESTSLQDDEALAQIDFYPVPHYGDFPFEECTKEIKDRYQDEINLKIFSNDEVLLFENDSLSLLKK